MTTPETAEVRTDGESDEVSAPAAPYPGKERRSPDRLIGLDAIMKTIRDRIALRDSLGVLIVGETGTGKERLARDIHALSPRKDKPFVTVDLSAVHDELILSELFGHEKGAFTSAHTAKRGLFEVADGGTVFLDEIGTMPRHLQPALLRVLQEREMRRVGGTKVIQVNARVIAATNGDLKEMVARRQFRSDLYYRLNVIQVLIPPVRCRSKEELDLLIKHFFEKSKKEMGRDDLTGFTDEALGALHGYMWPGNVRQLENAVHSAVALANAHVIGVDDLPQEVREPPQAEAPGAAAHLLDTLKLDGVAGELFDALRDFQHRGNVSAFHTLRERHGGINDALKEILEEIDAALLGLGLSTAEIARLLGVSSRTILNMRKERRRVRVTEAGEEAVPADGGVDD